MDIKKLLTEDNIRDFRTTFDTRHGRNTLKIILTLCHYYDGNVENLIEVGKRNVATQIIQFFGVTDIEGRGNRAGDVIEAHIDGFLEKLKEVPITPFKKLINKKG